MVYDATETISASIEEVFTTIAEAVAIVVFVILLFLGSFRSVLMPVVTIPLSLIGACFVLFFMGYSINLLSLLAMVLAIGLVVDDAIVVLENIHRHIEEGIVADAGGIHRHEGDLRTGRRHDPDAGCGFCAADVHRRPDRLAVSRIRRDACRRRRDFGLGRADDHADDVGADLEGRQSQPVPASLSTARSTA